MKCTNYCFKPLGLLFLLCLIPLWAFSQNITVKGVVKDATGESVIGASVVQKGTSNGIITDIDGNFTLNVPSNSTIVISFVGYKTQEFQVKNDKDFCYFLRYITVIFSAFVRMKKNRPCLGGVLCGNQFLKS